MSKIGEVVTLIIGIFAVIGGLYAFTSWHTNYVINQSDLSKMDKNEIAINLLVPRIAALEAQNSILVQKISTVTKAVMTEEESLSSHPYRE